jgi:defect in organelle trafficking protein DotD
MSNCKLAIVLTITLLLSACGVYVARPSDPTLADAKLTEAATNATHSLNSLAVIEASVHPKAKILPPPDPANYGMGAKASIRWHGPALPVIIRIAEETRYRIKVLGHPPGIPTLVTLDAHDEELGDILRDIGFQIREKARIVVFPYNRVIEIRYT